jgi:hypothetical protein
MKRIELKFHFGTAGSGVVGTTSTSSEIRFPVQESDDVEVAQPAPRHTRIGLAGFARHRAIIAEESHKPRPSRSGHQVPPGRGNDPARRPSRSGHQVHKTL